MFNLKKVKKARKRIRFITDVLFKLFQISLRYKEKEKSMELKFLNIFTFRGGQIKNSITLITRLKILLLIQNQGFIQYMSYLNII